MNTTYSNIKKLQQNYLTEPGVVLKKFVKRSCRPNGEATLPSISPYFLQVLDG